MTPYNKKGMKYCALLLFFTLTVNPGFTQEIPATVNFSGQKEIILNQNEFYYWENNEKRKIESEFQSLLQLDFKKLPAKVPNFGFIKHDVWFTFRVFNTTDKNSVLIFSLSNANLDQAELLAFGKNSKRPERIFLSDLDDFSSRNVYAKKLAFYLKVPKKDSIRYFLRINNGGEQFHFTPVIQTSSHFLVRESVENYFLGIFFGILVFVSLFNAFMWIITRERISLFYTMYLITFLFLQLSLLGFGKQYLWQENDFLSNHANPFFASASVFFLLLFSRSYLNLKNILPRIDKIFQWMQYPILLCAIVSLIPTTQTYTSSILFVNGFTFLLNIIILPVAFIVVRKGYQPAKLFLIAFFLLVVSVFAFVLKNFGVLPSNFFTDFGFQFGSSAEVILFSLGIVIRFKNFREEAIHRLKQINELKEKANIELEETVKIRTQEINDQKKELEYKNSEIISSISYAKRIQEAILPTDEKVKHLLPNSILWYAPKDIVAGDFYWIEQKHFKGKDYLFFAIADCTGHGVPGAMMSVLCTNSLNEALEGLTAPGTATILEKCSSILSEKLSQHSKEINDGMDISLCCLESETASLIWSGANNPLWILRNGELLEFNGTKRPIGKSSSDLPFEEHTIQLETEDRLFLFSDGIQDQFGGPGQKKFMKSRLREVIVGSGKDSLTLQINQIKDRVLSWKGTCEQVDDIAIWTIDVE